MILINPDFNRAKKLGFFARYVPQSVPMGLGALASYLTQQGKKVKLIHDNIIPITYESLDEHVKGFEKPYIFGITCVTAGIGRAYELCKMIKQKYPDAKTILGGIHPTVLPEEALNTGYVDIVVRREAEETMDALYDAIKTRKDYSAILGISFRDANGKIVHNENAPLPDLDSFPPFPYHLFENYRDKYSLGFIMSSRGCPYNCIFCSQRAISGGKYRNIPMERVLGEIDLLINKYNEPHITFFDDNFVVDRIRAKKLCVEIHERGYDKKATFDCQTRGDAIDDDIIEHLKMANFISVGIGLETATERLLTMLKKGEMVQDNIDGVRKLKAAGFSVSGTFILGLPTETREERWANYKLANKLDLNFVRFNNPTPYPGTELYEIAKRENRLKIEENWSNLNAVATLVGGPTLKTPLAYVPTTTTEEELRRDLLRINILFSIHPKRILKLLSGGLAPGGWLVFEKRWYLKPKEWYYLAWFSWKVLISLIKS